MHCHAEKLMESLSEEVGFDVSPEGLAWFAQSGEGNNVPNNEGG